jgi:tight adherence protein C
LRVPVILPAWGALLVAALFFTVPDLGVRADAARRRRDFRVAVGSFLDLVAMKMASGSGLAEALREAAAVGHGWAFARLRGALEDARLDGLTPGAALGALGEELGLADLRDLSATLALVDTSGAQAETSLRTKASSLRDREMSEAAGAANERSQAMLVAQVLLGLGFLIFLGYPAVARVLTS